ncbi:MAG: flagellar motor protein MotB [Bacteroidota bacterium]
MQEEEEEEGGVEAPTAPFWMATFSDLCTLLLTLFVLIVAMSEVKTERLKEALSYFQGRNGVLQQSAVVPVVPQVIMKRETKQKQSERFAEVQRYLKENDLEEKVKVDLRPEGLHVSITDSLMFSPARADLLPQSGELLKRVAEVLAEDVQSVKVEGHTDNQPIRSARFPSNWELSASRASSVVRFLSQNTVIRDPAIYQAVGMGEFRPVAENSTREGRARNRRVEILFSLDE